MKLLVDLPDELYDTLRNKTLHLTFGARSNGKHLVCELIGCVMNGTPLPKGRGRLLILVEECVNANSMKIGDWSCQKWISEVGISNSVMTIIEADKAEREIEE